MPRGRRSCRSTYRTWVVELRRPARLAIWSLRQCKPQLGQYRSSLSPEDQATCSKTYPNKVPLLIHNLIDLFLPSCKKQRWKIKSLWTVWSTLNTVPSREWPPTPRLGCLNQLNLLKSCTGAKVKTKMFTLTLLTPWTIRAANSSLASLKADVCSSRTQSP